MTAAERAAQINAENPSAVALIATEGHWAASNIHTAEELDHYLAVEDYRDLYKTRHGIVPSWVNLAAKTTAEIQAMITAEFGEPVPTVVEAPTTLTFNPFVGLKLK